ncbi:DHHW family protein [Flavonifractor hominis]|uniref:DHHW family protein n=1 Tax=Flavonifractor hominis TaxID=3133178 RepID=A0ABV1EPQ8_9FIRM
MNRRNTMTAVVFLAAVAAGLLLLATAWFGGEGDLKHLLKTSFEQRDAAAVLEGAESAANQDLDRHHLFIQLYGGVQRLTGRRVVEDTVSANTVVKLSTGALNFVDLQAGPVSEETITAHADATVEFARALEELGIPYRFVLAPQKIEQGQDLLPEGVQEYGNETADAFLAALEAEGTPYTDLRPLFEENGTYADWFFRTDHHWKPEAAFFAWQYLTGQVDLLATDPSLTDPDNWETTVLEDFFLGSQGKRVGSLYAGADDFTLYTPRFNTDLSYTCPFYAIDRTGPFAESVCFPERVEERDWFNGNPYTYYAGGDYPLATITNHENPDGPRVVLLRDSFACALTPFLSLSCSQLTTIDLRYFQGDLLESIAELEPDLVLTLYNVGGIGLDELFQYQKTE